MALTRPPYAEPRAVTSLDDCYFYHTVDIPGYGLVPGEWDLRPSLDAYLGRFDFKGLRVLDVGAASGTLTFHAERQGAKVVSFDLSHEQSWDIVPFSRSRFSETDTDRREHMRRINNGYWLCHRAFNSKADVVYGTVYDIPLAIEPVDVAIYGSILLHLRDPFLALENGARLARKNIIVTEVCPRYESWLYAPRFQPDYRRVKGWDTWWFLPPRLIRQYLAILGFEKSVVTWHRQLFRGRKRSHYTIVASR